MDGYLGTISICHAKIHRATVTMARKDYKGSITIDADLVRAAGMVPHQYVNITNLDRGDFWRTYVMLGEPGSGIICLNGTAAWHFSPGEKIIILAETWVPYEKARMVRPKVVFVDDKNRITEIETHDLENETSTSERFTPKA